MTDERMMALLLRTADAVEKRLEEVLGTVALSFTKYGALTHLVQAGEPLSLSELAARVICVRSNISQLVDRLEADGLVCREEDPRDRRCVRAALTPLGRERQAAGAERVQELRRQVAEILSGVDSAALERGLVALGGRPPEL